MADMISHRSLIVEHEHEDTAPEAQPSQSQSQSRQVSSGDDDFLSAAGVAQPSQCSSESNNDHNDDDDKSSGNNALTNNNDNDDNDTEDFHSARSSLRSSTLAASNFGLRYTGQEFIPMGRPIVVEPFAWQLSHIDPRIERYIKKRIHPVAVPEPAPQSRSQPEPEPEPAKAPPPYACTIRSKPPFVFLPSSSSTGFTSHDIPIVTLAEASLHPDRCYIPYTTIGHLELNDELIGAICPADLEGVPCPHDRIFEWNWFEECWVRLGCPMFRLCELKHHHIPPPAPAFDFPMLLIDAELISDSSVMGMADGNKRIVSLKTFRPPPRPLREVPASILPLDHPHHCVHCADVHTISRTCSSVVRLASGMRCASVIRGVLCPFGHDLESSRREAHFVAWLRHKEEAREKRGRGGTVWLNWAGRWCWEVEVELEGLEQLVGW